MREGCWVDPSLAKTGATVRQVDLDGATVAASFVDAHCHILPAGLDLLKLDLRAASSVEEVLQLVREEHGRMAEGEWLHAVQYDQNKWPGAAHLTRDELDTISAERPILLRHSSGHAAVANSAALRLAGVSEDEPDPPGGAFGRDASGRLDGLLLEHAEERVSGASPGPTPGEMVEAILRAGESMRAFGITAASDMMTGAFSLEEELIAYRQAAERSCPIRLRLYLNWSDVFGKRALAPERLRELCASMEPESCAIRGIKLFADGAIGSATAAIHGSYREQGGSGRLIYPPEELARRVRVADEAGWQVSVHAIGDRAVDVVLDAFEACPEPARHRLEHAMILSDSQIERIAKWGISVCMQPEFLVRFGHAYQAKLEPEVARRLKRFRSVSEAGVPLSFSSDRPIVAGDPWVGIRCATNRPAGFDASENLDFGLAWRAATVGAAQVQGDEGGTFREGSPADFQVFASAPEPSKEIERLGVALAGEFVPLV